MADPAQVLPPWILQQGNDVILSVAVQPRSATTGIVGVHDGMLRVRLTAPPVDGAANAALIAWCADAFGVRKAAVSIINGRTSRRKRLLVRDQRAADVIQRLGVPDNR